MTNLRDKPRRAIIRLLNDQADLMVALRRSGFSEDSVERITSAVAAARLTSRPADAIREPVWDWRDGARVRVDLVGPEDEL